MHLLSTFNSNQDAAFWLALRSAVFLSPLIILVAVVEAIFWKVGETLPIRSAIEWQIDDRDVLYSRKYLGFRDNIYKLEMAKRREPAILVVGSSRVQTFRSCMFHPFEDKFFNAGRSVQGVEDLAHVLQEFENGTASSPKVVIAGLDPWWFKLGMARNFDLRDGKDHAFRTRSHFFALRNYLNDLPSRLKEDRSRAELVTASHGYLPVGFGAWEGRGIRWDGSYYSQFVVETYTKTLTHHDHGYLQNIRNRSVWFEETPGLDDEDVQIAVEALRRLADAGCEVYALLTPVSLAVRESVLDEDSLATWWRQYESDLPAQLRAAGLSCLSVATPAHYGLEDVYMRDGIHAGETLAAYMVEELVVAAPTDSFLGRVDLEHLRALRERDEVIPVSLMIEDVSHRYGDG